MNAPRSILGGVALLGAAAAVWLARGVGAQLLSRALPGWGQPLLALLVGALAALLLLAAVARLRGPLLAVLRRGSRAVDGLQARLEKLPSRRAAFVRVIALGLLVGGGTLLLFRGAKLDADLELRALDQFFRLRFPDRSQVELATGQAAPSANPQHDVVVLAIDDLAIAHLGWPMARLHYAQLMDVVAGAGAKSLTFDVSLVDPSRDHPEWDEAIGDAAKRSPNVAFTFTLARQGRARTSSPSVAAMAALDENLIPFHSTAAALPEYAELIGADVAPQPVIDQVAKNARALAMANVLLDGGGDVLRHSLQVARLGQRLYPALSLRLAADALGVKLSEIRVYPGSHIDVGGKRRIPIDRLGRTLVRYQGRHSVTGDGPFRYVSIWDLLRTDAQLTLAQNPMGDDQRFTLDDDARVFVDGVQTPLSEVSGALLRQGIRASGIARYSPDPGRIIELRLSTKGEPSPAEGEFELIDEQTLRFTTAVATLQRQGADLSLLKDKHLLVGSTALAAADLRVSPLGELPGVEHHATMFANLLHDELFQLAPGWANALLIVGAALLAAAIGVALPSGFGLSATALGMLALITVCFRLFCAGVYVPVVAPSTAMAATALLTVVMGARAARTAKARAEKDREFVRQTFGRYLTEQVVQQLLDSPDGLKLGGKRDFVTIMMTDLRGFTSMCGSMEPEDVVKLLNHYLEVMTLIITRYGGTIDEFIGDAILVVFGAPVPLEHEELRAVACAIDMLNAMPEVNRWNEANGLPRVEMGIGIHSGEVVLGNIGSELRAKYGIVGSTINLTSRVESYTVGGQVLVSETTRERCGGALTIGTTQEVSPKGVKGTLRIHEALAVSGPFDVKLHSVQEQLVPPRHPLELRYGTVKNKQVAELSHRAVVEALSEHGMELRVDEELPALSDLQLRLLEGDGLRNGDLYGKVLQANVRPNVVYLRLTSVPAELRPLLDEARGGHSPAPVVVADSPLVST